MTRDMEVDIWGRVKPEIYPKPFEAMHNGMRNLHAYGLAVSTGVPLSGVKFQNGEKGAQEQARNYYRIALDLRESGNGGYSPHMERAHRARILRDYGFTYPREAATAAKEEQLELLQKGWDLTEAAARHFEDLLPNRDAVVEEYTPEAKAFMFDEYGISLSCLGRVAAMAEALGFPNSRDPAMLFEEAEVYLSQGANLFYRASNAGQAARWDIAKGYQGPAIKWGRIAAQALHEARMSGSADYEKIHAAAEKYKVQTASQEIALESVRQNP